MQPDTIKQSGTNDQRLTRCCNFEAVVMYRDFSFLTLALSLPWLIMQQWSGEPTRFTVLCVSSKEKANRFWLLISIKGRYSCLPSNVIALHETEVNKRSTRRCMQHYSICPNDFRELRLIIISSGGRHCVVTHDASDCDAATCRNHVQAKLIKNTDPL